MSLNARVRFSIVITLSACLFGIGSLACIIGGEAATPTPAVSPTSSIPPSVTIQAPQDNADAVVGQPITVQATGTHPDGVTRMELHANGQQVDSKISQNPLGDPTFEAYLNYTPTVAGTLLLQVIAYRGDLASQPAAITINVKDQTAQVTATAVAPAGSGQTDYTDPTCRAVVEVNGLNLRQGPGQGYVSLAVLPLGTVVTITGRLPDYTWWQGTTGNTQGWVSASYVTVLGSLCSTIPTILPPPSPAPTATMTHTPAPTVFQATPTTGLPDLTVVSIQGPLSVILDQTGTKTVSYIVTVQNIGAGTTGAFDVGLVLPDGTLHDMGTVSQVVPNQEAIFQTNVTFTAPGSARLTAIADMNNQIVESDESNNSNNLKSLDVVVIKPTPLPVTATQTPVASPTLTATNTVIIETATTVPSNTPTP